MFETKQNETKIISPAIQSLHRAYIRIQLIDTLP